MNGSIIWMAVGVSEPLWDKEECQCHTHAKLYLWLKEFNSWDPEAQRKGFRLFSELQAENQTNYRGYLSDLYQMLRGETIKGKKITSKSAKHPRQRKDFSAWTGAF